MRAARLLLYLFVVAVPLDVWPVAGVGSVALALGGPLAMATVLAVGRRSTVRRLTISHWLMVAFIMWSALSFLWSRDQDATAARLGTYLALFFFVWSCLQIVETEDFQDDLIFAYVCGCAILVVATLFNFARGQTAYEYETRYVAEGYDPNDLGVTLAIGIPMAWQVVTSSRGWKRGAAMLYVPAAVIATLLTASRGALLTTATSVLVIPALGRGHRARKIVVTVVAMACVACLAIAIVPEGAWERLFTLGEQVQTGYLNHRGDLWKLGITQLLQHAPFTGVGAGAFPAAIEPLINERMPAHNAFVSVLVELGPVGFLLFVGIIVTSARRAFSNRATFTVLLTLTWVVGVSSLTWEYRKTTWWVFALLISIGKVCHRARKEVQSESRSALPSDAYGPGLSR